MKQKRRRRRGEEEEKRRGGTEEKGERGKDKAAMSTKGTWQRTWMG